MTKLFVGQVPAICSEDQLSAIFGQFGEILDISIMRDKTTGRSKGSAWVVFEEASAAEDAIATLHDKHSIPPQSNSLQIRYAGKGGPVGAGQPPPVQQSVPQPPIAMPPQQQILNNPAPPMMQHVEPPASRFVPNQHMPMGQATGTPLAWESNTVDKAKWMTPASTSHVIPQQQQQQQQQQQEAKEELNEDGSPRRKPDKRYPPCGGRKLFVGQLPKDMTREDVRGLMADYGIIEELHVMTDKRTGQGTGAAFVIFAKRSEAQQAISNLNGMVTIPGMKCPMQVRFAEGELDRSQDGKLFVGQVPYSANEEDLKRLFSPFGELTEVALVRKGGQSKGCGFVRFTERHQADDAINALNGRHTMPGGHSPLTVCFLLMNLDFITHVNLLIPPIFQNRFALPTAKKKKDDVARTVRRSKCNRCSRKCRSDTDQQTQCLVHQSCKWDPHFTDLWGRSLSTHQ